MNTEKLKSAKGVLEGIEVAGRIDVDGGFIHGDGDHVIFILH